MRLFKIALMAALAALALAAPGRAQPAQKPVLVFAAASLQTALTAVGAAWERETGRRAAFSFAASSALARQIEQGAPADLFASADRDWMDWLAERKLINPASRDELLGNRLVLIAPRDATVALTIEPGFALAQALGQGRLATGEPRAVPAGRYARQALTTLGVWDGVAGKVAGAENVRAALTLVARGEAPLGIVYETDARTEPRVKVVGVFPDETHSPIVYPFALTAGTGHPDAAAFLAYLRTPAARKVFEAEGFSILR